MKQTRNLKFAFLLNALNCDLMMVRLTSLALSPSPALSRPLSTRFCHSCCIGKLVYLLMNPAASGDILFFWTSRSQFCRSYFSRLVFQKKTKKKTVNGLTSFRWQRRAFVLDWCLKKAKRCEWSQCPRWQRRVPEVDGDIIWPGQLAVLLPPPLDDQGHVETKQERQR